jgi:peptidoglycan pentaglycine glycine transferase (the first glycine)
VFVYHYNRRMSSDSLEIITDASKWDAWLTSQNAHLLQTYAWGELKSHFGWRAERIVLRAQNEICAAAQILYRPLAPGLTIAYIPRGPVSCNASTLLQFINLAQKHVRARGAFALKIEPDWQRDDTQNNALTTIHAQHTTETVQPPATIHIDLTADRDTILARMKQKWRYNIRLSERKGVVVRTGTANDFSAFYELMRLTGERDHFAIHGEKYYRTAFELLDASGHVKLFIAEFENQPLAMIFVTAFAHEAIYLYGASGNAERNRMPNHALHWAAIEWAKARGCTRYDLWGIPETIEQESDAENLPSSLYQFKQGFGGQVIHYSGAWDIVLDPMRYRAYKLARKLRKSGIG